MTSRILFPVNNVDVSELAPVKLAYQAGVFDSEGCVHIAKQWIGERPRPSYRLRLDISQNYLRMLVDFQREVGIEGRIYEVARTVSQNRTCYSLRYDGAAASRVLERLQPYLRRKELEAQVAQEFVRETQISRHFGPKGAPPEIWRRRRYYYNKLRSMK